ncbi:16S rRNA (cytidine(1402)-2'-O)-methyltransferase [soil metagenome]
MQAAAAAAAGAQAYPAASLYVVATPIGNLADLTLRAIHVLSIVDAIACEDTRHSAPLLRHLGIDKPLLPVHEHNERDAAAGVLSRLSAGERIAYISDAGTPAISDPGAALVAAARAAGYRCVPVPGASSVVTALSVSGDANGSGFSFAGFLSTKAAERVAQLELIAARSEAQVLFEAPHRIESLAKALGEACPGRIVTLCRELTKQFETIATMPAPSLSAWLREESNRTRGEFVIVLHARVAASASAEGESAEEDRTLRCLMAALPLKQAVALAAELTRAPRNRLYQRALALKGAGGDDMENEATPTIDT